MAINAPIVIRIEVVLQFSNPDQVVVVEEEDNFKMNRIEQYGIN